MWVGRGKTQPSIDISGSDYRFHIAMKYLISGDFLAEILPFLSLVSIDY